MVNTDLLIRLNKILDNSTTPEMQKEINRVNAVKRIPPEERKFFPNALERLD